MLNGLMKSNGWFPTMFDDFFNTDFMPRANSTAPAVNVKETDKSYIMELAAPGIKKEYCRVAINDEGNLTIAIENKDDVVKDQISAKVEDGILTITMPKTEPKEKVTKAIEVS